jgi:hypothetical protein
MQATRKDSEATKELKEEIYANVSMSLKPIFKLFPQLSTDKSKPSDKLFDELHAIKKELRNSLKTCAGGFGCTGSDAQLPYTRTAATQALSTSLTVLVYPLLLSYIHIAVTAPFTADIAVSYDATLGGKGLVAEKELNNASRTTHI